MILFSEEKLLSLPIVRGSTCGVISSSTNGT